MRIRVNYSSKAKYIVLFCAIALLYMYVSSCPSTSERMKLISQIAHGTCEGRTLCNGSLDTECIKKTSKELRVGCSFEGYKALKVCHQFLGKACSINDDFGDEELAELLVLLNSTEELIYQSEQLNYSSTVMLLFLLSPMEYISKVR